MTLLKNPTKQQLNELKQLFFFVKKENLGKEKKEFFLFRGMRVD